jgi:hypothetical protein
MQFDQTLAAGVEVRQQTGGSYFAMLSMGGTTGLTAQFYAGNELIDELRNITRIFSGRFHRTFDRVVLKSLNAATVSFVISDGQVELQGGDVNATIIGTVPVSNDRGAPGTPVYVSGVTYTDAPATSLVDGVAVAMTAAANIIVAANANRKALRITNLDATNAVALGALGITWAKRCIVLQPGETWIEERAGNLAWYGICNTALTASVTAQEVIA